MEGLVNDGYASFVLYDRKLSLVPIMYSVYAGWQKDVTFCDMSQPWLCHPSPWEHCLQLCAASLDFRPWGLRLRMRIWPIEPIAFAIEFGLVDS